MDTLHTMLRSLKGERKSQAARLTAFREFLDQIERLKRRGQLRRGAPPKRSANAKRGRKS